MILSGSIERTRRKFKEKNRRISILKNKLIYNTICWFCGDENDGKYSDDFGWKVNR